MAASTPSKAHYSTVSVFSGPVTRTWMVRHNARSHIVQLYHNTITGERTLSVDGVEIAGAAGTTGLFSTRKTLVYEVAPGAKGEVLVDMNGPVVNYHAYFNGEPIMEENSLLNGSAASGGAGASSAAADAADDADAGKLRITVEAGDLGTDESGKAVVWFRMRTVRTIDARETVVHRRFRDFYAINEALRSSYKGSQLLTSFPDLPSRSIKLWEDHLSEAFIEKRRNQLHEWICKVAVIPRMKNNPDFLTFLGIIDSIREVSVLFPKDVALGVSLGKKADFVEVVALKPLADGKPSPAQLSGLIHVGDKVSKINGGDCLEDSYDVVVAKLRTAARPLMVHFLGLLPASTHKDDEVAAAASSLATMSVEPSTAAVGGSGASATSSAAAAAEETAITGLIGEGISYVGTGATPKPATAAARKGLEHHAAAEGEEDAKAADANAAAFGGGDASADGFGGLL